MENVGPGGSKNKGRTVVISGTTNEHPLSEISTDTVNEISKLPGAEVKIDSSKGTVRVDINSVGTGDDLPTEKPL